MLNKVTLIGRLGSQPELMTTPNGVVITKFSLATYEIYTPKGGEKRRETEWHRVVLFGRVAENANQILNKGYRVFLEGKNKTRKWQDSATGQDRYSTEVVCHDFKILDSHQSSSSQAPAQQQQHQAPQQQQQQQHRQAPAQQSTGQQQANAGHSPHIRHMMNRLAKDDPFGKNPDEDIPF